MTVSEKTPARIFISSTFEDMAQYRDAAISAITNIEQLPIGMEQFVSTPDKSLDLCLAEVRRCQLFIALIAMRYGSVDDDSGKSYSELEYEEALKSGVPVLAFVIDENECPVIPRYVDTGVNAEKLKFFKEKIKKNHTISYFSSVDNLKDLITRSVTKQIIEDTNTQSKGLTSDAIRPDYIAGAKTFKKFLLLPERYKNSDVMLRIRLDGSFGTWKIREELFYAFNLDRGDTIFCNDARVLGIDFSDIDEDSSTIDVFAEGSGADWILENDLTLGSVFEGVFKLAYEEVPRASNSNEGYKKAALILRRGANFIAKDASQNSRKTKVHS